MPHLPALLVTGGSVKIKIPISEVKEHYKHSLFDRRDPVTESYPPHSEEEYVFERFALADHDAQIYKVQIHTDKGELFEFQPRDGKCRIEIYFAEEKELPLKHVDTWLERGEEICTVAQHNHK